MMIARATAAPWSLSSVFYSEEAWLLTVWPAIEVCHRRGRIRELGSEGSWLTLA